MTSREFRERVVRRTRHAGIALAPDLLERLEVYHRLLATWNRKMNLTALPLDDPSPETLDRLLVEPLLAASHVDRTVRTLIDIGSGGGSPAIPLILALPNVRLLRMVEAKTRKSVFLREAVRALSLPGDVLTARFEELLSHPDLHEGHELLTVRAVRLETRLLRTLQAFLKPGGSFFLFRSAGLQNTEVVVPPLAWTATFPLIGPKSRLVVLRKATPP